MLKSERKQIILSQLKQDGFVTLENLRQMANLNVFMVVLKVFMV